MPSTSLTTSERKSKNAPGAKAGPASLGAAHPAKTWTILEILERTTKTFGAARLLRELVGPRLIDTHRLEVRSLKDSTWRDLGLVTRTPDMVYHVLPGPKTQEEDTRRLRELLG
jgi:hypothetical protein